jgi:[acyl-carrier-protein] S-malonyltransferase
MSPKTSFDLPRTAFAFRGYNTSNLGKTRQLREVPAYTRLIDEELNLFGSIASEVVGAPVDLVEVVAQSVELPLTRYAESVALVVATESAQLRLLQEVHEFDYQQAGLSYGYSLGEFSALCAGGSYAAEQLIRVPLEMARDCAEMAADVTMGVLFSRGPAIPEQDVGQLCNLISGTGDGTIGVSAILSPNTYLLIGQRETVPRFRETMVSLLPRGTQLRLNPHRWPPLHTPIVRQRYVPDRASRLLETVPGGDLPPRPPLFSLVTGSLAYHDHHSRDILRRWVDQPQRLWDAVCATLARDIGTVIHVGPEPNVIPATFQRLAANVLQQTGRHTIESYGLRAMAGFARNRWLATLLPNRASLLRAPYVHHIILEDWLLEHAPG